MRRIVQRLEGSATPAGATLTLTFDQRRKHRLRARLDGGEEAALLLPRGPALRPGDRLGCEDGLVVAVAAAEESLSRVESEDRLLLARAAYHLGNRHVPVQLAATWLCYPHDHVLDDMVRALGLAVTAVRGPFQPEEGAYGHRHEHGHGHGHDHNHAHEH